MQPGLSEEDLWINEIFRERLGLPLNFVRHDNDSLVVSLPGLPGEILFEGRAPFVVGDSSAVPCSQWNVEWPDGQNPPVASVVLPGVVSPPDPVLVKSGSTWRIRYDLPRMMAWMLSRAEEVSCSALDRFGRFPARASHAWRNGYLGRPVVDEWMLVLERIAHQLWRVAPALAKQPSIEVSHDVDEPARYAFRGPKQLLRAVAGDFLRTRSIKCALSGLRFRFRAPEFLLADDPYNTFDWILSQSELREIRSSFYFICGRTSPKYDADYEVEHPAIRSLIRQISTRGHRVGLHPSFDSYQKPHIMEAESVRLRKVCAEEGVRQDVWGGRMHFLRWETPTTLYGWLKAGFDYDSTLGYAESPGFRCGTCIDYPAFDPVARERLRLRIKPLIAMDVSVISGEYLGLGYGEDAYQTFRDMKLACRNVGGTFSLLWHNTELVRPEQRELYSSVLDA